MEVQIANLLDGPVHVSVVRHSATSLEFVVSRSRVPIPTGTVLGHWNLDPGEALSMKNVREDANMSMSLQGYPEGLSVSCMDGTDDDGRIRKLVLRPIGAGDGTPNEDLN